MNIESVVGIFNRTVVGVNVVCFCSQLFRRVAAALPGMESMQETSKEGSILWQRLFQAASLPVKESSRELVGHRDAALSAVVGQVHSSRPPAVSHAVVGFLTATSATGFVFEEPAPNTELNRILSCPLKSTDNNKLSLVPKIKRNMNHVVEQR